MYTILCDIISLNTLPNRDSSTNRDSTPNIAVRDQTALERAVGSTLLAYGNMIRCGHTLALISVASDEPVQPLFKLRNSN